MQPLRSSLEMFHDNSWVTRDPIVDNCTPFLAKSSLFKVTQRRGRGRKHFALPRFYKVPGTMFMRGGGADYDVTPDGTPGGFQDAELWSVG
ncbi:hypothetical protein NDU88_006258 [Pleurodeles waltl]|uniref:Uncharacterized protein n=1 Tax=Pleurodeles waltl TaxID=8319 RepID=A0AAV7LNL3_PLEWA|nr:hypothetical protein NDU88_006258 [Pleurodeles waltl]